MLWLMIKKDLLVGGVLKRRRGASFHGSGGGARLTAAA